jgi:hypothetical protein
MTSIIESEQNIAQAKIRPVVTLEAQIQTAVDSYKAAHSDASEQAIADFRSSLEVKIQESYSKAKQADPRPDREKRAGQVQAVASAQNIQFKNVRKLERVPAKLVLVHKDGTELTGTMDGIFVDRIANKGGATFAYFYRTNETNTLYAHYALGVCRSDENFDALYGREVALERLLAGKVLQVEVGHSGFSTGKFSDKELADQISNYSEAFFPSKEATTKA